MMTRTKVMTGAVMALAVGALGFGQSQLNQPATAQNSDTVTAPKFEVDPFWPKPLGNEWILGNVIGIDIDDRDHVFIVHRTEDSVFLDSRELGLRNGVSFCCDAAPPILEFDPEGNLVNAWGGPGDGYTWPASNHGIEVAPNGNVWIGGNGGGDSHILVFTGDGEFVAEYGAPGTDVDSNATTHFGRVAEISIDAEREEVYVADGYTHKRIAVLDLNSGDFKRFWGAYGNKPEDGRFPYTPGEPLPQQFTGPVHCAIPSNDDLLYVCDRGANRIQVFRLDGTFVEEVQIAPNTTVQGSTWDIAFSEDEEQKYLYLVDGQNQRVHVMDRESLEVLTTFGGGGRQPGLWFAPHSIATDSKGNIYTTETYDGKRVQKFVNMGEQEVSTENQGAAWPSEEL